MDGKAPSATNANPPRDGSNGRWVGLDDAGAAGGGRRDTSPSRPARAGGSPSPDDSDLAWLSLDQGFGHETTKPAATPAAAQDNETAASRRCARSHRGCGPVSESEAATGGRTPTRAFACPKARPQRRARPVDDDWHCEAVVPERRGRCFRCPSSDGGKAAFNRSTHPTPGTAMGCGHGGASGTCQFWRRVRFPPGP